MKKKAIFTMATKGGVGKTTLAKAILEYLRAKSVRVAAYDADIAVRQLAQTYGLKDKDGAYSPKLNKLRPTEGVNIIDGRGRESEAIADALDLDAEMILVDLPGGQVDLKGVGLGDNKELFKVFADAGFEVVPINVISHVAASAQSVATILDLWGPGPRHVVAKCLAHAEAHQFAFFDGQGDFAASIGHPAQVLAAVGGRVISIPKLDSEAFALLDAWSLPMSEAIAKLGEMKDYQGRRARISNIELYIREVNAEIDALGLLD